MGIFISFSLAGILSLSLYSIFHILTNKFGIILSVGGEPVNAKKAYQMFIRYNPKTPV